MVTVDNLLDGTASTKESARDFIKDPLAFFDMSLTKMQSIPRNHLEELQATALSMRIEQHKELIPAISKLAQAQDIRGVSDFNEVLPLCIEHTIYKSYPGELLEKGRFDKLTAWLDRLTVHDLSGLDTSGCDSIHHWLDLLCTDTPLDPVASSGTTGTMSFTPRDKSDWRTQILGGLRIQDLQRFGEPPSESDLYEKLHVCWPTHGDGHNSIFRTAHYVHKYFGMDSEDHFHPMYHTPGDTDVLFLASRLRIAQAHGEKLDVPQSLLKRQTELEAEERDKPQTAAKWAHTLLEDLSGERVFLMGTWYLLYDVAKAGLAEGKSCSFAPDSIIQTGGGAKGLTMPDGWLDVVRKFFDLKFAWTYGFSEQTALCARCEHGRFHIVPWAIPLILDPDTSEPLPREGVQIGRAAFFDLAINGAWGGIISGDRIEIDWNQCPCGRTSAHIADDIRRFSEGQGGVDNIKSTATEAAHAKMLEFLATI